MRSPGASDSTTSRSTSPTNAIATDIDAEADVEADVDDDATTLVATGFASDPLATAVLPMPNRRDQAHLVPLVEVGDTAIITTPMLDRTPPSGTRVRIRRQHNVRRALAWFVGLIALLGFGYFTISLFQVWSTGNDDHRAAVDVIVVMGAAQYDGRPSPQLAARLDHAVELFDEEVAPVIFVTGGKQAGDRFTEAEASRRYLIGKGVPETAILAEDAGRTTWESLQNVAGELDNRGLDSVVIVTDPYHSLRSKLVAEELGIEAHTSATRTSPVTGRGAFWHHVKEAGGVAVGRIIGFSRLHRLID